MNFKAFPIVLSLAAILSGTLLLAVSKQKPRSTEWGNSVDGCRVRLVGIPLEVASGDALDVQLEIENTSGKAVAYYLDGYEFHGDKVDVAACQTGGPNSPKTVFAKRRITEQSG